MSQQPEHSPETEINAVYYHLITSQQHEKDLAYDPETLPKPKVEFHPDDVQTLVRWERNISRNIALWLVLMLAIIMVLIPFAPVFTPIFATGYALVGIFFYLRSRLLHETHIIQTLETTVAHPTHQWVSGGLALGMSLFAYYVATLVPYIAIPSSVQLLLFLTSMSFALYTPIAIIRVIHQRSLRRKHHIDN